MDFVRNFTHFNEDIPWFVEECTLALNVDYRRIFLFLSYLMLFMVGLVENSLVVWINWKRRHSCSRVLFCVLNIGISDLMMVLVMPFFMLEVAIDMVWLWGRFLCKFTYLVYVMNFYSSTFFLAYMTLERYWSLVGPQPYTCGLSERYWRRLMCGGLWMLAVLLTFLENVHVDLVEWDEPGCFMMPDYSYTEWFASISILNLLFQFIGPGAVIITCNVMIARAAATAPDVQGRRDVWLVHVYSLAFVLCWLPYHLVAIFLTVDDLDPYLFSCDTMHAFYFSYTIVQCLSQFHCIANPILYNFLSKSFRNTLINTVLQYVPQEAIDSPVNAAPAEVAPAEKGRRHSISSTTSHSDVNL
ncbi:G-protein coupled receptor 182 [Scleropages formosus]|uniref:G protein-coupled receptor 182 n=1 Tax=Scleropages formosus TaxID=113540 RepID=A0A8C9RD55_SCLFO|nr:G-protein coupled receptor 182 [Scleropages formosus]